MHSTDDAWRDWGKRDPYFAVITNPKFRQAALGPEAVREFFLSGERHVEHLAAMCRRLVGLQTFAPARSLDFGCGVGRIVVPLARVSKEVVGIDISQEMLEEARRNCTREGVSNATFALSDDTLSNVGGVFDFVHSFIVLQHIDVLRGRAFFQRLLDLTAPGGVAALHVTYAKAVHADRYGAPPPIVAGRRRLSALKAVAAKLGLVRRAPGAAEGDPVMQMNCYPLNDLLFIAQQARVYVAHMEFTDHGGELGVFFFLRKPPAPRP
jgi:SAM-dependent methyltransferase